MPKDIIVATVGYCIYCGATADTAELTDEHIVPFGLGGVYVLEKATCTDCQDCPKRIEQSVLRPMLRLARIRINTRTRRKKERKEPFRTIVKRPEGHEEVIHVLPSDLPAYLFLPYFDLPGLLIGREAVEEIPINDWWGWSFDSDPDAMFKALGARFGKGRAQLGRLRLDEFGRMLAKIAHGAAGSLERRRQLRTALAGPNPEEE